MDAIVARPAAGDTPCRSFAYIPSSLATLTIGRAIGRPKLAVRAHRYHQYPGIDNSRSAGTFRSTHGAWGRSSLRISIDTAPAPGTTLTPRYARLASHDEPQRRHAAARAAADDKPAAADVDDKRIKEIVIVGGGTAGWMAAAYLGKALGSAPENTNINITVLDAPEISSLGVGEATIPSLQSAFFDFLGIPEDEWMRACNASYKMGVKFINWRTPGPPSPSSRPMPPHSPKTLGNADSFYHLFCALPYHDQLPLSHYWFRDLYHAAAAGDDSSELLPYAHACYPDTLAMDLKKAPRSIDGSTAAFRAWHFDAHLVAAFLRRHATAKLGVRHVQDKMIRVEMEPGRPGPMIRALHTASGRVLQADLFLDCTGFRGLLINEALQEPFLRSEHLLCDSAVAMQVPHDDSLHGVEPYTSAIAMDSGWTWKIPMLGRFGAGYVYSSSFASEDEAARDLCKMWPGRLDPEKAKLNKIRFRVGRNRRAWVGNCVAIGAASCFLEPLESTGIFFIYAALYQLVQRFPDRDFHPGLADDFNSELEAMFTETRDFMQVHFSFSPRTDTAFWRAARELKLSRRAEELVAAYRAGLVVNPARPDLLGGNLDHELRNFWTNSSYYCVLAGVGLFPDAPFPRLRYMPESVRSARRVFEDVQKRQRELVRTLPSLYDYLRNLHQSTPAASSNQ